MTIWLIFLFVTIAFFIAYNHLSTEKRGIFLLFLLFLTEYVRQLGNYYDLFDTSTANIAATVINALVIVYVGFFRLNINKIFKSQYRLVALFWVLYFLSSILSIFTINVEPKEVVLIAVKVFAFLIALLEISSVSQIYWVGVGIVILGSLDFILGGINMLPLKVVLGGRELGFNPWIREDTIWLAQGLFWANLVYSNPKKLGAWIGKWLFLAFLGGIFFYGLLMVQIRMYALDAIVGLMVIIFLSIKTKAAKKIILFCWVAVFVVLIVYAAIPSVFDVFNSVFNRDDGGRYELWTYSLDLWEQSPIIGNGFGADGVLLKQFELPGRMGSHNVYFILAIEIGLLGLGYWLYLNYLSLKLQLNAWVSTKKVSRSWALIIILHTSILFHILFHGLIYFPWLIILTAFPFALYANMQFQNRYGSKNALGTPEKLLKSDALLNTTVPGEIINGK